MKVNTSQQILRNLRTIGNGENYIKLLLDNLKNAKLDPEITSWIKSFKIRPFYPAKELSYLWPLLAFSMGIEEKLRKPIHPQILKNHLGFLKCPVLENKDGTCLFNIDGEFLKFYIIHKAHLWTKKSLTVEELNEIL